MSRTLKDAPAARRSRAERRFARSEKPFAYKLSDESRAAAAAFLGLSGVPTDDELAAAPCPHGCTHQDAQILPFPADVMVAAELTQLANASW